MPTVPSRDTAKAKKLPSGREGVKVVCIDDPSKSDTNVTGLEVKWAPSTESCPAPLCKSTYMWFSTPKTMYNASKLQRFKRPMPDERDDLERYRNLMCDRRVVRGTNFKQQQILARTECAKKVKDVKCRQKPMSRNLRNVIGTPPPVPGRCHERVQTEKYLEELFDRPPEMTVNTQTDLFLEQPLTPPYIPAKIGIDVYTEIEDGELFDFDAEVEPIVETLVGHCVQQGLLEVSHEEEVAELEKRQQELLAKRQADLAELQRLEAEELRLQGEKDRRLRQDAIAKELDKEMEKGVTAAKLLQGHIASLLPEVLENLEPVSDAVKKEKLEKTICPWLTQEVAEEVGHIVDCREVLTLIIEEIIKQRATIYGGYHEPCEEKPITVLCEEEDGCDAEEVKRECDAEEVGRQCDAEEVGRECDAENM